jgi:hypothetical protein
VKQTSKKDVLIKHVFWNKHTFSTLSSAEAIGIGLHEVSWGEGGARGATGRRKKEEKASAGYCAVLRSF